MTPRVKLAMALARYFHENQLDKSGVPYIAHILDVWSRVTDQPDNVQVVALLHDIVEDTRCSLETLAGVFSEIIVEAVKAITQLQGEDNDEYYARVKANYIALTVKRADIASNTSSVRWALLSPLTQARLKQQYDHAIEVLGEP